MSLGFLRAITLVVCAAWVQSALAQTRSIEGNYRNPALGYSIRIPHGLNGLTGAQAGPERGVGIALPSGGKLTVFGEANSLGWKTPDEGIKWWFTRIDCESRELVVKPIRLGKIRGSKGTVSCRERVLDLILAFRRDGGPIYWLQLDTVREHKSEDEAILQEVAASFKLIRWE